MENSQGIPVRGAIKPPDPSEIRLRPEIRDIGF
jgi:hypothetical protein